MSDREALQGAVDRLPRARLATLPTPLEPIRRLGAELGVENLLVKRDDETGLALGGNKARMFEFVIGELLEEGYDSIVSGAPVPANYCRQLAAACARAELDLHMVLGLRDSATRGGRHDRQMLMYPRLLGAHVHLAGTEWTELSARIDEVFEQIASSGGTPFKLQDRDREGVERVWTVNFGLHAVGYVNAFLELVEQVEERGLELTELWLCSSEATQAGLVLAARAIGHPCRIVGVSPVISSEAGGGWSGDIARIARDAAAVLGLDLRLTAEEIENLPGFDAGDEGEVTAASLDAVTRVARTEGLLLDPVYTGKAMAAMLDDLGRRGGAEGAIVYLHTGGLPATASYAEELSELLPPV